MVDVRTPTYDPFTWRLEEIDAIDNGHAPDEGRRAELSDELLVAEAEELAHGRHHLTIVHTEPHDMIDAEQLDQLCDEIDRLTAPAEWRRIRSSLDYLTVTIAGPHAARIIEQIADTAARANPGHWHIIANPRPAFASNTEGR